MGDLVFSAPQVVFGLPMIVTLIVGLVLLVGRRERLAPRARALGVAGLSVLLAGALADVTYLVLVVRLISSVGWEQMRFAATGFGLLFVALQCVGMALLIAALLATAPQDPWGRPPAEVEPRAELG